MGGAQLLSRIDPPVLAAQPFAVQQTRADGTPLVRGVDIVATDDWRALRSTDVAVVTVGVPPQKGRSRLRERNGGLIRLRNTAWRVARAELALCSRPSRRRQLPAARPESPGRRMLERSAPILEEAYRDESDAPGGDPQANGTGSRAVRSDELDGSHAVGREPSRHAAQPIPPPSL